jgi:hypothetical protein
VLSYLLGVSRVQEVEKTLQHGLTFSSLKDNMVMAQNWMKKRANKHRFERHFKERDMVFLGLQPYKNTSLKEDHHQKLAPNFYGLYKILKCIGLMAYKLELPSYSKIHLIFHLSYSKKVVGSNFHVQTSLPKLDEDGSIWLYPEAIFNKQECCHFQHTI